MKVSWAGEKINRSFMYSSLAVLRFIYSTILEERKGQLNRSFVSISEKRKRGNIWLMKIVIFDHTYVVRHFALFCIRFSCATRSNIEFRVAKNSREKEEAVNNSNK